LQELKKWRKTLKKAQGYTKIEVDCEQIKRCIQIGLICVSPDWTKRPTTTKIIEMLQGLESSDCSTSSEAMPSADQVRSIESNAFVKHALFVTLKVHKLLENIIIIHNLLKFTKYSILICISTILETLMNTTTRTNLLL
jgi:hypothetical protein